jgi:hypothetical protein
MRKKGVSLTTDYIIAVGLLVLALTKRDSHRTSRQDRRKLHNIKKREALSQSLSPWDFSDERIFHLRRNKLLCFCVRVG